MRLKTSTQLFSAIVLVSTLSLLTGVPLIQSVHALPAPTATEVLKRQDDRGRSESRSSQNRPCGNAAKPAVTRSNQVPEAVKEAIFRDITRRTNGTRDRLRIVRAEEQTWRDGCLGLAEPGMLCTQALVPGWRIGVESDTQRWIYRSDRTGGVVKLERDVKRQANPGLQPIRLSDSSLPPALEQRVMFRSISTGGFIGQTSETLLFRDGRVIHQRVNLNGTTTPLRQWQISQAQMQQFQNILRRERFDLFDHLGYSAKAGSADFLTVTLSSPTGTVQYADSVQSQLPRSLQTVIQAWNALQ